MSKKATAPEADNRLTDPQEKAEIIELAAELAGQMHRFIKEHTAIHRHALTTVGFATEMMLHVAAETPADYDQLSTRYREFLAQAHDDLRWMMASQQAAREQGAPMA